MNPYDSNPFATDDTRDSRSEFTANAELKKTITRKEILAAPKTIQRYGYSSFRENVMDW